MAGWRGVPATLLAVAMTAACAGSPTAPSATPQPSRTAGAGGGGGAQGIRPYAQVITSDMRTDDGIFAVHFKDDDVFYEIPASMLGKEMLLVTSIARTASNLGYGTSRCARRAHVRRRTSRRRTRPPTHLARDEPLDGPPPERAHEPPPRTTSAWATSDPQTDFGVDVQRAERARYATRWRLEPSDTAAFLRGELVEPVKPIVYYIDPATPEKWRPYLKQGVDDWNVAFEAAGFRNAIRAADPPTPEEDPEFSPEDVRYSVIRYFSSTIQNAYGPHVSRPRTGEILESTSGGTTT
jgi:hypothetical protein